eukprot:COSAG02_NODE_1636_length_11551_cov_2.706863_3_plen_93_part_00
MYVHGTMHSHTHRGVRTGIIMLLPTAATHAGAPGAGRARALRALTHLLRSRHGAASCFARYVVALRGRAGGIRSRSGAPMNKLSVYVFVVKS